MAIRQRPVGPSPDQILAQLLRAQMLERAGADPQKSGSSSNTKQNLGPQLGDKGYSQANDEIAKALFSIVASPILSASGVNPLLAAGGKNIIGMPSMLESAKTLLSAMGIGSTSKSLTRAKAADASRKDSDPDVNGSISDITGEPTVTQGAQSSLQSLLSNVFGNTASSGGGSPFPGTSGSSGGGVNLTQGNMGYGVYNSSGSYQGTYGTSEGE